MGRRRNAPAEDFIDLVALLPWWIGVALAVVIYLVLHDVAGREVAMATKPGQFGAMAAQTMWKTLASIGQYLVPVLCLVGAGASAWRRRERKGLLAGATHGKAADALDGMTWRQFEMLVGEAFRQRGYRVAETGGSGPDGGIDLVLTKGSEKFLVQCKQWKAFRVGVDVVRELYGAMAAKGAAGGFVVTSGRFTEDAERFAQGRNVELVDGPKLHALIRSAQQVSGGARQAKTGEVERPPGVEAAAAAVPVCPVCSKPMIKRKAKRGASAGREFWGCADYPSCRGTRQLG